MFLDTNYTSKCPPNLCIKLKAFLIPIYASLFHSQIPLQLKDVDF